MPVFDDPDNPALDESERNTVNQRLNNLMADTVRQDFSEPEVVAFIDRQRDRLTDDNGVPIRTDFEPFRPPVKRSDARLESPVGAGEANHPLAVFNTKKPLNGAGFHTFKPGIEPIGEASPRFLGDLKRFQFDHDLIPDAAAQPGGPTVHMLTRKVFGTGDGPLPDSETEFFRERFGKDPNRTLSGQPILGAGIVDELGVEPEAAPAAGEPKLSPAADPPAGANLSISEVGSQGESEPFGDGDEAGSDFLQLSEAQSAAIIGRQIRRARNAPTLTQLAAFDIWQSNRNPFSPLRLSPGKIPEARAILKEIKNRGVGHLTHEQKVLTLRHLWANTSRTPEQNAAVRKLLVALPPSQAFVADRDRRARAFAKTFWSNADVKTAMQNWSRISDSDRLQALQTIANLHAKAYGLPAYTISNAKLPGDRTGEFNPTTQNVVIDLSKMRQRRGGMDRFLFVALHEGSHRNAYALARKFVRNQIDKSDPRFRRSQIYALQALLYISSTSSKDPLNKAYRTQPSEVDANAFARSVLAARTATSAPTPLHR